MTKSMTLWTDYSVIPLYPHFPHSGGFAEAKEKGGEGGGRYFQVKIIDIHTHGIGGYDTRTTTEEDIIRIAEIHGSFGVSEIIVVIYPSSVKIMSKNITAR